MYLSLLNDIFFIIFDAKLSPTWMQNILKKKASDSKHSEITLPQFAAQQDLSTRQQMYAHPWKTYICMRQPLKS